MGLRPGWMAQKGGWTNIRTYGHTEVWTYVGKISLFYRASFPIGAAAQKQGKGIAFDTFWATGSLSLPLSLLLSAPPPPPPLLPHIVLGMTNIRAYHYQMICFVFSFTIFLHENI